MAGEPQNCLVDAILRTKTDWGEAGDHPYTRDPAGDCCRASERVRPTARPADDGEPIGAEAIGHLGYVVWPVEQTPTWVRVREADTRTVKTDDPDTAISCDGVSPASVQAGRERGVEAEKDGAFGSTEFCDSNSTAIRQGDRSVHGETITLPTSTQSGSLRDKHAVTRR
jgi:hypothetical protein